MRKNFFGKPTLWDRICWWWSRNIKERWYWLKCYLWRKHNHVRIRTLPVTWSDRTEILPHAMFQVLSDFMEKEKPGERIDWSWNEEHAHVWKEMNELYEWWHNTYLPFDPWKAAPIPEDVEPNVRIKEMEDGRRLTEVLSWGSQEHETAYKLAWEKHREAEEDMERQLEENSIRLIRIRRYLWT